MSVSVAIFRREPRELVNDPPDTMTREDAQT